MKRFSRVGMAVCLLLADLGVAAAASSHAQQTDTIVGSLQAKAPFYLTDAQRQQLLKVVSTKDTGDKMPPDFQPTVGVKVPSQKKLPLHPIPRPLVNQVPLLKQYYYAKLPNNILIVDPMTRKVVDVIALH